MNASLPHGLVHFKSFLCTSLVSLAPLGPKIAGPQLGLSAGCWDLFSDESRQCRGCARVLMSHQYTVVNINSKKIIVVF